MAIAVTDLTTLDPIAVTQALDEIVTRLQELHPTLDLRRGPLHDLLAYYHALLAVGLETNIARYQSARSLVAIAADPTLADPGVVDDILSNFLITRRPAAAATGSITIVVATDLSLVIAQGAVFVAGGRNFATPSVFSIKAEAAQIVATTDRLFAPLTDGTFAFTLDVVALDVGTAGLVRKDTAFLPLAPPAGFVAAYATTDFTGGADAESTAALLARLGPGVAAKALSNRVNMRAALHAIPAFAAIVGVSIVGHGDPEMLRDQHSILPLATGGRVDWYARTTAAVGRVGLTKSATLVAIDSGSGTGTWQLALGRDEAPGCYEIRNIRPDAATATGGFAITADLRTLDLTGPFVPDVINLVEGAYSRYQALVVQFLDTAQPATGLTLGATRAYQLEARALPLIADLQDYAIQPDVRPLGADILVRAPIPCFVQVSLVMNKRAVEADPDVAALAQALAAAVGGVGFIGRLDASLLLEAIGGLLPADSSVGPLDLLGRIRRPDGTTLWLRSASALIVSDDPAAQVTARTVAFFLDPEDVAIGVVATIPMPD